MIPENVRSAFYYTCARNINYARIKHLDSLNLDFSNKKILETGCGGVGDITKFLISKNAEVTLNDARKENIFSLLINIEKSLPFNLWDLNILINDVEKFDIIVCYGTLYHLTDLDTAIKNLANLCKEFAIISTMTNAKNNYDCEIVYEGAETNQSITQYGSRPGRFYIWKKLAENFKYVYCIKTQPDHEEYPLKFPATPQCCRNIFIGSHVELKNELLVDHLINEYYI
jgi:2-polyprenyl-3-methyl-5-hydroxy-6-metoxy-1,4-benzoquinol methylase